MLIVDVTFPPRILAEGPNRLLVAAGAGDHDALRHLIEDEGISPSHEFQHGITALHEVSEGGHDEAVKVLLSLGADVNKQVHIFLRIVCITRLSLFYIV